MRAALAAVVVLLAGGDEWSRCRGRFYKAFKTDKLDAKLISIREVAKADRVEAAETLVKAFLDSERRLRDPSREKVRVVPEHEAAIQSELTMAFAAFRERTAVRYLMSELKSSASAALREILASAAWRLKGDSIAETLVTVLRREKSPAVLAAAIDSVAILRREETKEALLEALEDSHWKVRLAAARALVRFDAGEAVPRLIAALEGEGPLRDELNDALILLTGVDKKGDAATWKAWWAEKGEDWMRARPPVERRREALLAAHREEGTRARIYGMQIVSRRILFLLDISGSMLGESDWQPDGKEKSASRTKIDVARFELRRAINALPPDAVFNIIVYNSDVEKFISGMRRAGDEHKREAYAWLDEIAPDGGTNTYEGLMSALMIAGVERRKLDADTIYLISDGRPSVGEPGWILGKVRAKNPFGKVIIHTISVGEDADREFMQKLADENGGTHIER